MPSRAKTSPLRVAWLVTPLPARGGTLTHLNSWAIGLDPSCIKPILFYHCPEEDSGIVPPFASALKRVRLPGLDMGRHRPIVGLAQTVRALRQNRIEMIHSIFVGADLVGMAAGRLLRLPVISSIEGSLLVPQMDSWKRIVMGSLYRALSPGLAASLAVSGATARGAERYLAGGRDVLQVMYPGVAPAPLREPGDLSKKPLLVGVGRLAKVKRFDILIDAAACLKGRLPGLRLVLVGDGPERGDLERRIREKKLQEIVTITGWLPPSAVEANIRRAHLLAIVSEHEGLPWVALEAMVRGVPVLATRAGGLPELIVETPEPLRTGFLIDVGDSRGLVKTIEATLGTSEGQARLTEIGRRARLRVMQRFSAEREIRQLTEVYRRVSGEGHRCALW